MTLDLFIKELKKLGIEIDSKKIIMLERYYELLVKWNEITNLTRIVEKKDVYLKHFYDSLTIVKVIDLNSFETVCDVGTGAGFPGVVLKILFPQLKITLIDSLNKRIIFLKKLIEELKLEGIEVIHDRMEYFSKNNIEKFDLITSRAVAKISILAEISVQSLKINGHLVLLKANCDEELEASLKIFDKIGLKLNKIERFKLPIENSDRTIVDIIKTKKTDLKYPRAMDKIKKSL